MEYTFFTRDFFENRGDFDFTREHYEALINMCFETCKYFSLLIREDTAFQDELATWQLDDSDITHQNEISPEGRYYYHANPSTREFFLNVADSLFSFEYYHHRFPEDPVFYREDMTIFLDSVVHEGECSMYPLAGEDVAAVLAFGHWLEVEEGAIAAPAREHQLTHNKTWDMLNEPLYLALRRLQAAPWEFISQTDIVSLLLFVEEYCDRVLYPWLPLPLPRSKPEWYTAFRMYILGECDAKTNDSIADAMEMVGLQGKDAYDHFFVLLDEFTRRYALITF